jgi:membrane protease YdiL (CAAX protease family)
MTPGQPFEPLGPPPDPPAPVEAPSPVDHDRYPFWRYSDVVLFLGLLTASFLIIYILVPLVISGFHISFQSKVTEALIMQGLLYVLAFSGLAALLQVQYQRPFWRSLGWTGFRLPMWLVVMCGIGTAFGVGAIGILLRTPNTNNRMTEMMQDPHAVVPIAIFAITLGPLAEELAFRGFLQPLLVRSLGPVMGVIAAAIPFGLLHFPEYGYSWRYALLIALAGAAFGWMRHRTGSTEASTLMHASYNALEFVGFLAQQKGSPHT